MWKVSFNKRGWSYFIDLIVSSIITFLIIKYTKLNTKIIKIGYFGLFYIIMGLVTFIYLTISYSLFKGTSVGRIIFNMHLVSNNGKLRLIQIIIRSFMQAIIFILPISIIYQMYHHTEISLYNMVSDSHFEYFINKQQK